MAQREFAQREFANAFRREQAREGSYCPNVFVLRPIGAPRWQSLVGQRAELQLWCQEPGCWHPTKKGGKYVLDEPRPGW